MTKYVTTKRIFQKLCFGVSSLPMSGHGLRPFFCKLAGIKVLDPKHTFIGQDITFDGVNPELIVIESGVRLTTKCIILTHYIDPKTGEYSSGEVRIKKNAFIGAGTIITKPVTIGEGAIVGAGSIVTKDVPDCEVWAGNPARFIRKR